MSFWTGMAQAYKDASDKREKRDLFDKEINARRQDILLKLMAERTARTGDGSGVSPAEERGYHAGRIQRLQDRLEGADPEAVDNFVTTLATDPKASMYLEQIINKIELESGNELSANQILTGFSLYRSGGEEDATQYLTPQEIMTNIGEADLSSWDTEDAQAISRQIANIGSNTNPVYVGFNVNAFKPGYESDPKAVRETESFLTSRAIEMARSTALDFASLPEEELNAPFQMRGLPPTATKKDFLVWWNANSQGITPGSQNTDTLSIITKFGPEAYAGAVASGQYPLLSEDWYFSEGSIWNPRRDPALVTQPDTTPAGSNTPIETSVLPDSATPSGVVEPAEVGRTDPETGRTVVRPVTPKPPLATAGVPVYGAREGDPQFRSFPGIEELLQQVGVDELKDGMVFPNLFKDDKDYVYVGGKGFIEESAYSGLPPRPPYKPPVGLTQGALDDLGTGRFGEAITDSVREASPFVNADGTWNSALWRTDRAQPDVWVDDLQRFLTPEEYQQYLLEKNKGQ